MSRRNDSSATRYIRAKATKLRNESRKAATHQNDEHAGQCNYAARQMDILADELDHGFDQDE